MTGRKPRRATTMSDRPDKGIDLEVSVNLIHGAPVPALLAASTGADLLVLGSRGHGGFATLRHGLTSHTVLRHAGCPVVVVPSLVHREKVVPA